MRFSHHSRPSERARSQLRTAILPPVLALLLVATTGVAQWSNPPAAKLQAPTTGHDKTVVQKNVLPAAAPGLAEPGLQGGVGGTIRGSGLETELVGTVDLLPRYGEFMLGSTYTLFTDERTTWAGTDLRGYTDLLLDMVVRVKVDWEADGSLRAMQVNRIGVGYGIELIEGKVIETDPNLRIHTGQRIIIDEYTQIDGDVTSAEDIEEQFTLTAECALGPNGVYFALQVLAEGWPGWSLQTSSPSGLVQEVLVILSEDAKAATVAERYGAEIRGTLAGSLVHLFYWQEPLDSQQIDALLNDPEVTNVELNYEAWDPDAIRRRNIALDRNPSSYKYLNQRAVATANITPAHMRTTGAGTLVALIDTGVDRFHPLLRSSLVDGGWDYVDNDANPWETHDGIDGDNDGLIDEAAGHGTFVAGLILLVAPEAKILPYRVLNDDGVGTTFNVCQAMLDAMDRGVDVINMSFANRDGERPAILDRVLDEASRRGVVLVAGAGNGAKYTLPFPADDHRVIAVAAADEGGDLADFTNLGPEVDLVAPGVNLYSGGMGGIYGYWEGTSMAAPLVSGAVALLRSVNPRLRPAQIRQALVQSAMELPSAGADTPGMLQVADALGLVPTVVLQPAPRHGGGRH